MTEVLGKYTGNLRDAAIQDRIYGTPGVLGIAAYDSSLARQQRAWDVHATINTTYGQFQLAGPI